jgi:hypothetical protein
MQIHRPNDGLIHGLGLALVLGDLLAWGFLLKSTATFTLAYYGRFIGMQMYVLCIGFPVLGVLLSIGCFMRAVRKGFGPVETALAVGLFFAVCFNAVYLALLIVRAGRILNVPSYTRTSRSTSRSFWFATSRHGFGPAACS